MGDWNLFFATSAGSAATLLGLLFVAMQLHLDVYKDPQSGLLRGTSNELITVGSSFLILFGFAMRNA